MAHQNVDRIHHDNWAASVTPPPLPGCAPLIPSRRASPETFDMMSLTLLVTQG